ncbi:MAG: hypothetical protein QOK10_1664 [Pseudonocardiales bacterium]|nr:hypothetical protein [Pseudonocardiales bacterium]
MAQLTNDDLLDKIAQLEAENAALREDLLTQPTTPVPPLAGQASAHEKRSWGWTLLATALIAIGAVLAPVAIVASWARVQLTQTDSFVAAYAPLANDPAVQAFVTDETLNVIQQNVDIPSQGRPSRWGCPASRWARTRSAPRAPQGKPGPG